MAIYPTRSPLRSWRPAQLRWVLGLSFLLLALPTLVLSIKARQQIKWEALYQQRQQAEELTRQVDNSLQLWLSREARRPVNEYNFLLQETTNGYAQRSPLSQWPDEYAPPGLVGYFQVDQNGRLNSPLLPTPWLTPELDTTGLSAAQIKERQQVQQQLSHLLSSQQLLSPAPDKDSPQSSPQSVPENFRQLAKKQVTNNQRQKLGSLDDLQLERGFADAEADSALQAKTKLAPMTPPPVASNGPARASDSELMESNLAADTRQESTITLFSSDSSQLNMALLDSGHLLLFRYAWRNNQRLIQGLILQQDEFLQQAIAKAYHNSSLAQTSDLVVALQGDVLSILKPQTSSSYLERGYSSAEGSLSAEGSFSAEGSLSAEDVSGTLLLQTTLSAPLTELELLFSAKRLPEGPGAKVITWATLVLFALLIAVFVLFYRMALKQIQLFQQQQNFIASVSHELKTPLTSIRMFSEILKAGWTTPEKQQEYYSFISAESERLSRLITNVLQLARMERQELALDCKPTAVKELVDIIQSRVQSQLSDTDFALQIHEHNISEQLMVRVDSDAILQILMNLVDNSVKFAKDASNKLIELNLSTSGQTLLLDIRDYGPGIPKAEQKQVFNLFYRIGNELTRSAQGTGIGLALVQQLVSAMNGSIELSQDLGDGAGFRIRLPLLSPDCNG
jgi:signal transduction histidine kinase